MGYISFLKRGLSFRKKKKYNYPWGPANQMAKINKGLSDNDNGIFRSLFLLLQFDDK